MTGLRNNECVTPTDASDCGGGVPIYDARMGGNVCVATAQQCEADKVLVNSNTCTPKAMICMGTEGYLSSSRSCGEPTSAMDCAGLTNAIYNERTGMTNHCVAATGNCDADEAAIAVTGGMACVGKAMACMGTEGYLSNSKSCGVPTQASDCTGLTNKIFNADSGGNECVATCPEGDGLMTGRIRVAWRLHRQPPNNVSMLSGCVCRLAQLVRRCVLLMATPEYERTMWRGNICLHGLAGL